MQGKPATDASYAIESPIEHYFPESAAKPPKAITYIICFFIALAILGFFVITGKLEMNMEKFPSDTIG